VWAIKDYAPGTRSQPHHDHEWGGGRARRLLQAAYTLAFLCLLRFDEVLKIQAHDIEIISDSCISLTLPFRKTSQFGGRLTCIVWVSASALTQHHHPEIKPFVLHALPAEEAHLCPIRALAEWLEASNIKQGYLFRKISSGDRVLEANCPIVCPPLSDM